MLRALLAGTDPAAAGGRARLDHPVCELQHSPCLLYTSQGIPGRININKTSAEVAEDRLETKLETSVKRLGSRKEAPDETV